MAKKIRDPKNIIADIVSGKKIEVPELADHSVDMLSEFRNKFSFALYDISLVVSKEIYDGYLQILNGKLEDCKKSLVDPEKYEEMSFYIKQTEDEKTALEDIYRTKKQYTLNYTQALEAFDVLEASLGNSHREKLDFWLDTSENAPRYTENSRRYMEEIIPLHCAIQDAIWPDYDSDIEPWDHKIDPNKLIDLREELAQALFKPGEKYNIAWGPESADAIAGKVIDAAMKIRARLLGESPGR